MLRLLAILLFASLSLLVAGTPLHGCSCPPFDKDFHPLSHRSGVVGNSLHCIYIKTSRCLYNPVGFLLSFVLQRMLDFDNLFHSTLAL